MSDSSTSAIDDKNDDNNNNNSDDSDTDNWGGFALSLLQTSIFYFLIVLFASGYIFWTRVPYQLIMEIFPTLDSKFGREFYCPKSCKKGRVDHKEELKKRGFEIEQRRKQREQQRLMESKLKNNKVGGKRKTGGSAKCSQAKLELGKTHSFKISTPSGMMSFPYNLNTGNPSTVGTWFASSTQWVYVMYRWIIVSLLGWEVVKPEDASNIDLPEESNTKESIGPNNTTDKTITINPIINLAQDSNAEPINDTSTVLQRDTNNILPQVQETGLTDSKPDNIGIKNVDWGEGNDTRGGSGVSPGIELSTLNAPQSNKAESDSKIESSTPNTNVTDSNIKSSIPDTSVTDSTDPTTLKPIDPLSTYKKDIKTNSFDDLKPSVQKISRPSFLNEDRQDDNTMTNRFATYPGPLLFLMSMGMMLYFITLLLTTGLLSAGSGIYACWNAGFPWGFGYIFLFLFMSYFTGGINIAYQFFSGLYYFLIYPFIVNPKAVGEKFKYYPGFICSCNAGFLLVIYGLFVLMAAGSNLTGTTQLGLGIGYYALMIIGLAFSGKKNITEKK